MLHLSRLAAATLVLLPALAVARQDQQQPNPLDPAHPVPQPVWRSVFERYQSSKEETETPDKRWLGINQQLMPKEKPAAQPTPAAPAAPAATTSPAAPSTRPAQGDHHHAHGGH